MSAQVAFGGAAEPVEDVLQSARAKVQCHGGCRVWSSHSRTGFRRAVVDLDGRSIGGRPSFSMCTYSSGASPTPGVRSRMSTETPNTSTTYMSLTSSLRANTLNLGLPGWVMMTNSSPPRRGDHVAALGQPVEAVGDGGEVGVAELVVVAVVQAVHVVDVGDGHGQLTRRRRRGPLGEAAHG